MLALPWLLFRLADGCRPSVLYRLGLQCSLPGLLVFEASPAHLPSQPTVSVQERPLSLCLPTHTPVGSGSGQRATGQSPGPRFPYTHPPHTRQGFPRPSHPRLPKSQTCRQPPTLLGPWALPREGWHGGLARCSRPHLAGDLAAQCPCPLDAGLWPEDGNPECGWQGVLVGTALLPPQQCRHVQGAGAGGGAGGTFSTDAFWGITGHSSRGLSSFPRAGGVWQVTRSGRVPGVHTGTWLVRGHGPVPRGRTGVGDPPQHTWPGVPKPSGEKVLGPTWPLQGRAHHTLPPRNPLLGAGSHTATSSGGGFSF